MDRLLTIGDPEDLSAVYLAWLAERRGLAVTVLDEARFGLDWYFVKGGGHEIAIIVEADSIAVERPSCAVVVRLNPRPATPAALDLDRAHEMLYLHERRSAIEFFLNTVAVPVANRPLAGRSNNSKPYQMSMLARAGFAVPPWTVTNDAETAQRFAAARPLGCVYKACSGLRSRVRRFDEAAVERLREGTSPIVLQEYVEGVDARVHVAGSRVYATMITGAGTDYRFESDDAVYAAAGCPAGVIRRCVAVTRAENLVVTGIDFRIDTAGQWWCLELNPVPTFLPYEASTGQPIGDAVLDALAEAGEAQVT